MTPATFDAQSPRGKIHVLGVPLDHGAGRRGVSMGPSALRIAGLKPVLERLGCEVLDWGDVSVAIPEVEAVSDSKARYLPTVADCCQEIATDVEEILARGAFPLVIGGDHSLSVGSISGVAAHLRKSPGNAKLGVIWFDAHGDINTPETSPSGNIHGMPVACLLGHGPQVLTDIGFPGPKVEPMRFVQVGLRDIDRHEQERLVRSGIHTFTMEQIDRRRIADVMEEAIQLAADGVDHLHVSFDIDVMDPSIAPGTGTPKKGGLTYREAHTALEMLAECGQLKSFEVVEVNPVLDHANKTAELAIELIASALGERIL